MVDSLGRRNHGFSFINSNGLNAGYRRVKEATDVIWLRLSHRDKASLDAKAKAMHITRAELIRTYITWGLEAK